MKKLLWTVSCLSLTLHNNQKQSGCHSPYMVHQSLINLYQESITSSKGIHCSLEELRGNLIETDTGRAWFVNSKLVDIHTYKRACIILILLLPFLIN